MSVVDSRAMATELHCQRAARLQMLGPVDPVNAVIERFGVCRGEAVEYQQHAVRESRPEAQPIRHLQRGRTTIGAGLLRCHSRPMTHGLFEQQAFETLGAGEDKFVAVGHGISRKVFGWAALRLLAALSKKSNRPAPLASVQVSRRNWVSCNPLAKRLMGQDRVRLLPYDKMIIPACDSLG